MQLEFKVQDELTRALAQVTQLRTRDLPFVAATAINMTMKEVKADMRAEMAAVFDAPTPFTLNSLQTYPFATKDSLTAVLRFRDFAGKGTPAGKYLAPEIYGGQRRLKGFERALQAAGMLPEGLYAVPARASGSREGAPLNKYGNMTGPYLNAMLSYLRANRDSTQNRSTTKKRRGRSRARQWFVVTEESRGAGGKQLPLGIYERRAGAFHMVIKFVRAPTYQVRFKFHAVAQASAAKRFPANIDKAASLAINALKQRGATWNVNDLLSLWPPADL